MRRRRQMSLSAPARRWLAWGSRPNGSPWIAWRIDHGLLASAVLPVPRRLLRRIPQTLAVRDRARTIEGRLVRTRSGLGGIAELFAQRGIESGDIVMLDLELSSDPPIALLNVGEPELVHRVQYRSR